MKYIITDNLTQANETINRIERHIQLQKNDLTVTYAEPTIITNSSHTLSGQYVIPVSEQGWLKCDDLFDSSVLVDRDSTWFQSVSTSE